MSRKKWSGGSSTDRDDDVINISSGSDDDVILDDIVKLEDDTQFPSSPRYSKLPLCKYHQTFQTTFEQHALTSGRKRRKQLNPTSLTQTTLDQYITSRHEEKTNSTTSWDTKRYIRTSSKDQSGEADQESDPYSSPHGTERDGSVRGSMDSPRFEGCASDRNMDESGSVEGDSSFEWANGLKTDDGHEHATNKNNDNDGGEHGSDHNVPASPRRSPRPNRPSRYDVKSGEISQNEYTVDKDFNGPMGYFRFGSDSERQSESQSQSLGNDENIPTSSADQEHYDGDNEENDTSHEMETGDNCRSFVSVDEQLGIDREESCDMADPKSACQVRKDQNNNISRSDADDDDVEGHASDSVNNFGMENNNDVASESPQSDILDDSNTLGNKTRYSEQGSGELEEEELHIEDLVDPDASSGSETELETELTDGDDRRKKTPNKHLNYTKNNHRMDAPEEQPKAPNKQGKGRKDKSNTIINQSEANTPAQPYNFRKQPSSNQERSRRSRDILNMPVTGFDFEENLQPQPIRENPDLNKQGRSETNTTIRRTPRIQNPCNSRRSGSERHRDVLSMPVTNFDFEESMQQVQRRSRDEPSTSRAQTSSPEPNRTSDDESPETTPKEQRVVVNHITPRPNKKAKTAIKKASPISSRNGSTSSRRRQRQRGRHHNTISKGQIQKLARKGGVYRISKHIFPEANAILKQFVKDVVETSIVYAEHKGRDVVKWEDVVHALKQRGQIVYGFP